MKQIVIANSGGLDSAIRCRQFRDLGYQVHSLYIDFNRLGREEEMIAAKKTADEFCVSHHTIKVDLGYSPAHYESADSFVMQDDVVDGQELSRYYAGPPNMPMIVMALTVSYAKSIGVNECSGGYNAHLPQELFDIYNTAQNLNLSLKLRPQMVAPDTMSREELLTSLDYKAEDFNWVYDSHEIPEVT